MLQKHMSCLNQARRWRCGHIRDTGKQDPFTPNREENYRVIQALINQTTISKPNKWVALATKAKLVLLYAGRHVRTHTGTKNIVYRRDTKVQILCHASLGQKCVTFEKGERNKLVFFCKGRTASCRFRSPSLSHAAHVT